jgi:hypothetical protein
VRKKRKRWRITRDDAEQKIMKRKIIKEEAEN